MEHNADRCIYPPIHVHVTLGNEDLTVKVPTFLIIIIFSPVIVIILLTLSDDLIPAVDCI